MHRRAAGSASGGEESHMGASVLPELLAETGGVPVPGEAYAEERNDAAAVWEAALSALAGVRYDHGATFPGNPRLLRLVRAA
jgi:hypothetical protein